MVKKKQNIDEPGRSKQNVSRRMRPQKAVPGKALWFHRYGVCEGCHTITCIHWVGKQRYGKCLLKMPFKFKVEKHVGYEGAERKK